MLEKGLFGHEAEAGEKIKQEMERDNPGISGLDLSYKDGVVSLSGQAESREALEKVVLMVGNVQGVAEVRICPTTKDEMRCSGSFSLMPALADQHRSC